MFSPKDSRDSPIAQKQKKIRSILRNQFFFTRFSSQGLVFLPRPTEIIPPVEAIMAARGPPPPTRQYWWDEDDEEDDEEDDDEKEEEDDLEKDVW